MGVDAILFAKKSKTYYDIDRERNFRCGLWVDPNPLSEEELNNLSSIMDKISNKQTLNCQEVMVAAELNIKAHSTIPDIDALRVLLHNGKIIEMVKDLSEKYPDEEFILLNDCGDFDEYIELKKYQGYVPHPVSS